MATQEQVFRDTTEDLRLAVAIVKRAETCLKELTEADWRLLNTLADLADSLVDKIDERNWGNLETL